MEKKELLALRTKMKKSKREFVVKESNFSARVKRRWRYPRGKHSAVRQEHRGRPVLPSVGFGSPKAVKGLHSSGLEKVLVKNSKELLSLNPKIQGAVLAKISIKKKLSLLKLSLDKKISILNVKDSEKLISEIEKKFNDRIKLKQKKLDLKTKKEEERIKEQEKKNEEKAKKKADKKKESGQKNEGESDSVPNDESLENNVSESKEKSVVGKEDKGKKEKELMEKTITKRQ